MGQAESWSRPGLLSAGGLLRPCKGLTSTPRGGGAGQAIPHVSISGFHTGAVLSTSQNVTTWEGGCSCKRNPICLNTNLGDLCGQLWTKTPLSSGSLPLHALCILSLLRPGGPSCLPVFPFAQLINDLQKNFFGARGEMACVLMFPIHRDSEEGDPVLGCPCPG